MVLYKLITEKLGYHKFCECWVTKLLTNEYKTMNMVTTITFLLHYDTDDDYFLSHFVTSGGDLGVVCHCGDKKSVNGVGLH